MNFLSGQSSSSTELCLFKEASSVLPSGNVCTREPRSNIFARVPHYFTAKTFPIVCGSQVIILIIIQKTKETHYARHTPLHTHLFYFPKTLLDFILFFFSGLVMYTHCGSDKPVCIGDGRSSSIIYELNVRMLGFFIFIF